MEQVLFSQIPDAIIERSSSRLHRYTTALMKVTTDKERREHALHIGSGTFVSIDGISGILTANHVTRNLDGPCELGLSISTSAHAYKIDKNYIRILDLAVPESEEFGPDISFVVLPTQDVGTIKAFMSFHPLLPDRDMLLRDPPALDRGIWFLCGVPAERTTEEPSQAGFDKVIAFQHFAGAGGVEKHVMKGGHDYVEMTVHYSPSTSPPTTFGGMSGGGLWQVLIGRTPDGEFHPIRDLLSGIVFCQSELGNKQRSVRCHFRRSLYKHAYDSILAKWA